MPPKSGAITLRAIRDSEPEALTRLILKVGGLKPDVDVEVTPGTPEAELLADLEEHDESRRALLLMHMIRELSRRVHEQLARPRSPRRAPPPGPPGASDEN